MLRRSESESSSLDSALTKYESEDQTKERKRFSFTPDARFISDAIIGLSDGLTVPFALTAGLSALGNTNVVIYGGLAELTAGAISMGLGGYLGAKSEEDSYKATERQTCDLVTCDPQSTTDMISSVFSEFDVPQAIVDDLTLHLSKSPRLPDFLMRFHHSLAELPSSRAFVCALTIGLAYFFGGLVPLLPYFFVATERIDIALWCSIGTMIAALFLFGYCKTCFVSGWRGSRNVWKGTIGGIQMVVVGSVAAGSAMGLVKAFQGLATDGKQ
ncbi:vacuolar iron transporter Ccc1 [Rhizodiscina lignyota]|uniref:Vacuolar iron transporter Ccc1 n=1 Tax=Rhizodiscina lignyota TaxID=1504668 RepID=A0A9P4M7C9_9PEZI|nr:vacuolar iron transporter Ccc1 [Rhizodiscina lignyota]